MPAKAIFSMLIVSACLLIHLNTVSPAAIDEVRAQQGNVEKIIDYVMTGSGKHQAYDRLANITDMFGNRVLGSQSLENAIDYAISNLKQEGFENVAGEEAVYPKWIRGTETAQLLSPFNKTVSILGLGTSVGTGSGGITAGVVVVDSFDELDSRVQGNSEFAKDKIVVFNAVFTTYSETVSYRSLSASKAANVSAVAALVRSVTPYSLYTPHTGAQSYESGDKKIPVAAITIEDADMLSRMYKRGQDISVKLVMTSGDAGNTTSRTVVAEIVGSKYPEQVVIIGGHIDSWDVGTGAMDDGGGVMISWEALSVIKKLGLTPKRTIRTVFWTAESTLLNNLSLIMESDSGTFKPNGLKFTGNSLATEIMQAVLNLLGKINTTILTGDGAAPDTGMWVEKGVPGGQPYVQNEKYFYYHHTEADTLTMQSPEYMDMCTAMWAAVAYVVADLEDMLPRGEVTSAASRVTTTVYSNLILSVIFIVFVTTLRKLI